MGSSNKWRLVAPCSLESYGTVCLSRLTSFLKFCCSTASPLSPCLEERICPSAQIVHLWSPLLVAAAGTCTIPPCSQVPPVLTLLSFSLTAPHSARWTDSAWARPSQDTLRTIPVLQRLEDKAVSEDVLDVSGAAQPPVALPLGCGRKQNGCGESLHKGQKAAFGKKGRNGKFI